MSKTFSGILCAILLICSCATNSTAPTISSGSQAEKLYSYNLSNQIVYGIAEDKNGHVWIGTFRGLNRFDGLGYTQYFCYDNNEGLQDNHINDIFCDDNGRMWVATVNGACIYNDNDRFTRVEMAHINRNIEKVLQTTDGSIFMYSSSALLRFNEQSGKIETVLENEDFPYFATIFAGSGNSLWAVNSFGLTAYDATSLEKSGTYTLPSMPIASAVNGNGNIWISTETGIYVFNTTSRQFKLEIPASRFNNTAADIYKVFAVGNIGVLFISRQNGCYAYDIKQKILTHQEDRAFPFEMPKVGHISTIFRDSLHNIWLGTEDEGFFVAARNKSIFSGQKKMQESFKGKQVTSLTTTPDGSTLIAATKNSGVITYDCLTDQQKCFSDIQASQVMCDSKGKIWINCTSGKVGVNRYSLINGDLRHEKSFDGFYALSIAQGANGDMYFGGIGENIAHYSYNGDSFRFVRAYFDNRFTFIPGLLPLSDSSLLVSGFFRDPVVLNPKNESVGGLMSGDDIMTCIKRSVMVPTKLYKDKKGLIWIGTVANGLLCYDPSKGKLSPIEGAPCVDISSIEEDEFGNIWVSTMNGIGRLNCENGEFANFYFDPKQVSNQYYDRASCTLADGTIVFGGPAGIVTVKASNEPDTLRLPFVFEDIKVSERSLRPGPDAPFNKILSLKPKVNLLHSQNSFSIRYATLDYSQSGRSHYYYKLEGFDKQWHDAGASTEAFYTKVKAGNYAFRVRYQDDSHMVLPIEDYLNIAIKVAPWASWWAMLLYALLVGSIFTILYRMRRRIKSEDIAKKKLEEEKEQEKALNKMNMSFFANVAHEFRTPLTTIKGPLDLLVEDSSLSKSQKKILGVMQKSTDRMMHLVNQFLDFNKLQNGNLRLEVCKGNICESVKRIAEYFELSASLKHISITTEGLHEPFEMFYDADKLTKIMSNLISNAIKYTNEGGSIKIGFYTTNSTKEANIYVADNGIGIDPELREKIFERYYRIPGSSSWGTGIGLNYAKSLALSHHGNIRYMSNDDSVGSVFTLTLPTGAYSESEMAKPKNQTDSFPISNAISELGDSSDGEEKTRILVIDDDPDICNYLKILLSASGYKAQSCFDADSGLSKIKAWEPDLVICDVAMPRKNGYEFCTELRSDVSMSHIPLILVTAKTSVEDQVKGLESGADAYITKPFDPKYLTAMIKSQLDKRHKMQIVLNESTDPGVISEEETLSSHDKAFLSEFYQVMEENVSGLELDLNDLASKLHISRTKLYYKVKGLTGESPAAFFRNFKLNKAAEMICDCKFNLSEISDKTGFASQSHFSTAFKKRFGMSPSEYAKSAK